MEEEYLAGISEGQYVIIMDTLTDALTNTEGIGLTPEQIKAILESNLNLGMC